MPLQKSILNSLLKGRRFEVSVLLLIAIIGIWSVTFKKVFKDPLSEMNLPTTAPMYKGTLEQIKEKRLLRVLTTGSSFNYFIYNGRQSGFEYDMAKKFVDQLNKQMGLTSEVEKIRLKMVPVKYDQLFYFLENGLGDMIAAGMTYTKDRAQKFQFTTAYNFTSEIIVHNSKIKIDSIDDLAGRTVHVRQSSSYVPSLNQLNQKLKNKNLKPLRIEFVDESLDTESILEMVSLGRFELTVADSHLAFIAQKLFDELIVNEDLLIREKSSISWVLPQETPQLLQMANSFLPQYRIGSLHGNINIKRYFKNAARIKSRYFSETKLEISPFDSVFKKYAQQYAWDWRLLAAIAYQESRFRQNIKNRWGATGVMQIKQAVAQEPYVDISSIAGPKNYDSNIHAGVKYLTWLKNTYFDDEKILPEDQIYLSLAAYNAGPGRLKQARKKAKEWGHNPNKWFGELEYVLLKMNFTEPVKYVGDIHQRHTAYVVMRIPEK